MVATPGDPLGVADRYGGSGAGGGVDQRREEAAVRHTAKGVADVFGAQLEAAHHLRRGAGKALELEAQKLVEGDEFLEQGA